MQSIAGDIATSITATLARFADPSQRIFWPFILTSAAIALAICAFRRERLGQLFSPAIWMHRSARMDYRLLFTNAVVKTALWGSLVATALWVVIATDGVLRSTFGEVGNLGLAQWQITALYTLVLFVGLDASRYALHRLMHAIPFLWQFHQVHHSAEVLTPVTVYRVHPLESFLYGMRGALFTGLISGLFWFLFHGQASQAELLGINAIGIVLNALGANLRHSHIWLSYGRVERFLMSPAQHQMHHDLDAANAGVNYGAFLSVWDRLGGSFRRAVAEHRPQAFGLAPQDCNHAPDSVASAYLGPVRGGGYVLVNSLAPMVPKPATALLAVSAMQCTNGGGSENVEPDAADDGFDRAGLVRNIGENVIVGNYQAALDASVVLSEKVAGYCEGIEGAEGAVLRDDARAAWLVAMQAWQRAELSPIGPAAPESLSYRDFIYSWPVISGCAVDQGVMDAYQNNEFSIDSQLLNRRGLDSLEYLLFNEVEDSVCAPQIRPEGWDALPSIEKRAARCGFAEHAVADLIAQQEALVLAWTGAGGYLDTLTNAGQPGAEIASEQAALNTIFGGMFYLELQTKDVKLGASVGATENSCNVVDEACLANLESPLSAASRANIIANLDGFAQYIEGEGGLGFGDFLVARGASATTENLQAAIAQARTTLEQLDPSLGVALQDDFAGVQSAYAAMQDVTTILKDEMPGILQLEIPQAAGGDAD